MKKILAMMLTAAMMLSMGTAALAADGDPTITFAGASVKVTEQGTEERVSWTLNMGDTVYDSYTLKVYHDADATDDNNGTLLATITPIDEAINQSSSLMTGKHDVKMVVSNGISDNWYQVNATTFSDAEYPNKVVFTGKTGEADVEVVFDFNDLAPQTIGEGDTAVTTSDWIEFEGTANDAMYPGQDAGVKHFNKVYKVDAGETTPEETFKFDFEFISYVDANDKKYEAGKEGCPDAPEIDQASVKFTPLTATKMDAVPVELDADDFPVVGVYTYKVTEVDNNIAGVTYATDPIYLVVTILRSNENDDLDNADGEAKYIAAIHYSDALDSSDKIGEVVNSYDSDSLAITKQVEGNLADTTEYFKVTVKFTAPTGDDNVVDLVKSPIYYTAAKDAEDKAKYNKDASVAIAAIADATAGWSEETVEIWLRDGDTITFTNIPVGVTYEVVEEKPADYEKVTYSGTDTQENSEKGSGKIDAADTVLITNYKDADIDTGISVDSIPYIAMLGVVAVGGAGFMVSKKRRSED